jgi:hypothetical protein
MQWLTYSALVVMAVCLLISKWSVVRMVRQINRLALPGGERLILKRVSLWWWPNYKDRRIWRLYCSLQPHGFLRAVYPGSLAIAGLVILIAIIVAAHVQS